MPILGVHHVAIIAGDYAVSRRFYTEVLGYEIVREVHRAERRSWKCDLRLPGAAASPMLELFSFEDAPSRQSYPEARGLRHLAFAVDDLDAEVRRLAALGVAVEPVRVDEHTGRRFTFFADPDGLPLELYETE
jgi:glyoxylase I family protein